MPSTRDFRTDLREQLDFLAGSMASFDAGLQHESKRIATVIRVLLHDHGQRALMSELNAREEIKWLSIAVPFTPSNLEPTNALVSMRTTFLEDGLAGEYVPLDLDFGIHRWLGFDQWWRHQPIIHSPVEDITFTRRNLVLMAANRDGGAHVGRLAPSERRVAANELTPWGFGYEGNQWVQHEGSPVPSSLRAIATEIIQTIGHNAAMLGVDDGFTAQSGVHPGADDSHAGDA